MDIGWVIGANRDVFWLMAAFGIVYNALIAYLEQRGWLEGYVSLAVAAGVGTTLLLVAFIDAQAALLVLVAFAFTGLPMIVGSIVRYMKAREHAQEGAPGNDQGEGMA